MILDGTVKNMERVQSHSSLAPSTILKRPCKDHRPKQFLHIVGRCATVRDWRFSGVSVVKITFCGEFFNFEKPKRQN